MRALSLVLLVLALPAGAQTRRFYYVPIQNGAGGGGTPTTRVIGTGTSSSTGLSGGGDLSADRSLACVQASTSSAGCVSTGTDAWAGNKSTTGTLGASNLSGSNTGDVTIGTFGSSPTANGALLSGQSLLLQPADGTHPGAISLSAQTMGSGTKTFSGQVASTVASGSTAYSTVAGASIDGGNCSSQSTMLKMTASDFWRSDATWKFGAVQLGGTAGLQMNSGFPLPLSTVLGDGSTSVAIKLQAVNNYVTAGAQLVSVENNVGITPTRVLAIDKDGAIQLNVAGGTRPTCAVAQRGKLWYTLSASGTTDNVAMCLKAAADTYSWVQIVTGG